ncbi:MAG: hypothetical protein F4219_01950 [Gammaproteobacteria bacterium]|nr:hypothetical protein [Gammaproteobacteria bacterium]
MHEDLVTSIAVLLKTLLFELTDRYQTAIALGMETDDRGQVSVVFVQIDGEETLHEIELPSSVVSVFQEAISQVEFGLANTPARSRGES